MLASISIAFFAFLIFIDHAMYATAILLFIIATAIMINLYYVLNRVNRDVTYFLLSIKNDDMSQRYSNASNQTFKDLYDTFKLVLDKISDEKSESVDQYYLLQLVIEHIRVGLISFKADGNVDIYNHSARQLFDIPYINHINDLHPFNTSLVDELKSLEPNRRKLLKITSNQRIYQLAIEVTEFKQHNESYRLASIQNIREELDQQEIESWQKLIRVLNHEVFNSITPIVSLSESTKSLIENGKLDDKHKQDVNKAFSTIERRGKNLLAFVDRFRSITHIPKPVFNTLRVKDLIHDLVQLFKSELNEHKIECEYRINPDSIEITADRSMIEQVLINIMKNAIQALMNSKKPKIEIEVVMSNTYTQIAIRDNGNGIEDESADKIFIPFYSTKQNGSGIGLSLSKQIMAQHKGEISFESSTAGTTFYLKFHY
jgi:two-component system nitrogen regulation sensor histidine kinase NtrY